MSSAVRETIQCFLCDPRAVSGPLFEEVITRMALSLETLTSSKYLMFGQSGGGDPRPIRARAREVSLLQNRVTGDL